MSDATVLRLQPVGPGEEIVLIMCPHGDCRSEDAHEARARRERVTLAASMDLNAKGVDYQPGQVWTASPRRKYRRRTGVVRT